MVLLRLPRGKKKESAQVIGRHGLDEALGVCFAFMAPLLFWVSTLSHVAMRNGTTEDAEFFDPENMAPEERFTGLARILAAGALRTRQGVRRASAMVSESSYASVPHRASPCPPSSSRAASTL